MSHASACPGRIIAHFLLLRFLPAFTAVLSGAPSIESMAARPPPAPLYAMPLSHRHAEQSAHIRRYHWLQRRGDAAHVDADARERATPLLSWTRFPRHVIHSLGRIEFDGVGAICAPRFRFSRWPRLGLARSAARRRAISVASRMTSLKHTRKLPGYMHDARQGRADA